MNDRPLVDTTPIFACHNGKLIKERIMFIMDKDTPNIELGTITLCMAWIQAISHSSTCGNCLRFMGYDDIWVHKEFNNYVQKQDLAVHFKACRENKSTWFYIDSYSPVYSKIKGQVNSALKVVTPGVPLIPTKEAIDKGIERIHEIQATEVKDEPFTLF